MRAQISNEFTLTTAHPASSYGIPVLVRDSPLPWGEKENQAYGPADRMPSPFADLLAADFVDMFGALDDGADAPELIFRFLHGSAAR